MAKEASAAVEATAEKETDVLNSEWTKATDKGAVTEVVPKQRMFYPSGIRHALERAIEMDMPVLMVGDTGTGKTSFIRELAREHGTELIRLNLTGQTGVDELVGKYLIRAKELLDPVTKELKVVSETYWINGPLIEAMESGKWIVFDEVNMGLPEILAKLHSLLDDDKKIFLPEKDSAVIRPHKNFRLFGAMNPSDEYAGTKELNKAFLSRFPVILNVDYSDNELDILIDRTNIDEKTASHLVLFAQEIRSGKQKDNLTYTCSTRDLIYCCQLIVGGIAPTDAIQYSLINKAPMEERTALAKMVTVIMGKEYVIEEGGKKYVGIEEVLKEFKNSAKIMKSLKERADTAEKNLTRKDQELEKVKLKCLDLEKKMIAGKTREEDLREKLGSVLKLVGKKVEE